MNLLIIGSGGREHALAWKLKQSPRVTQIFCAPGNAGTAALGTNLAIPINDHEALMAWARENNVALTVVGPDDALAAGIVDKFEAARLKIFGPNREAAQLESSKIFGKDFMQRHGIPTARSGSFSNSAEAHAFSESLGLPVVIKADGLALGKGVIIAETREEAAAAIERMMVGGQFGDAGRRIVVEEFLSGEECSIHALVDGASYLLFPAAQDHKRALDGDAGPNTGGMGTYSPPKLMTEERMQAVREQVMEPFMRGLSAEGLQFRGMLFPGLMVTADGIRVLEFNCRFGDPETQVLLARLESDLLDLLEATVEGSLATAHPVWRTDPAVCVVLASGGYPGSYASGKTISGLENFDGSSDVTVFHAGTKCDNGATVTAGGRVLGVTALGGTLQQARERAYEAVGAIHFEGAQCRSDIAVKGL